MLVQDVCATMQEGRRARSCAGRQAGRQQREATERGNRERQQREATERGNRERQQIKAKETGTTSTCSVAAEPELVGAADVPVVSAVVVQPEGKRVAKHEPGDGDQSGNRHGLQSRRQDTPESGEATCQQKQWLLNKYQ